MTKSIKVRQIEAFKYFMITGSVTSAAELLHVTQPAASRLLHDLESRLDFRLFNRTRNKMIPTPEAHIFYREVQNLFIGLDALMKVADSISRNNTGRLRIGFLHVMEHFITDLVIEFLALHPKVNIELEPGGRTSLEDMVKSNKLDMAIIADPMLDDPALSIETIGTHAAKVVMHVDNPLANNSILTAQDLANERFVVLGFGSPFRRKIELAFDKAQIKRNIILEARTQHHIYNLVSRGLGTAILDEFVHVDSENIVLIPFEPKVTWEYAIITLKAKQNSRLINAFNELALNKF
ncbi:MAG: LysR family transcriptional regulator [Moritella sp.]|uniref:LysR family transcriptional regulator n=1 Tax=unclassified Moritella TaxID=2637987 RepID=UPI0001568367|nr:MULTISPECIES: LysR family transcriptional regulator [unclassified Moritella]EDM68034.1 probable LysR-family transcriptional regulator [Moritella sp. PE36]MBL1417666.1 LysR family transcriptional regulator [Moritella sp.]PHR88557.1 MAG: LysR family transcriptional regulator [Moritella sp.]